MTCCWPHAQRETAVLTSQAFTSTFNCGACRGAGNCSGTGGPGLLAQAEASSDGSASAAQVSADPLDEPHYACNIPEALARLLAANVGLDLSTYLLYA